MNMKNNEGVWRLEYLEFPSIENTVEPNESNDTCEEPE